MSYKVGLAPAAQRGLQRLPTDVQRRVTTRIDRLADDPHPPGAVSIVGTDSNVYRIRVGDYRIVYHVNGEEQVILVLAIGHRKDVYRQQ